MYAKTLVTAFVFWACVLLSSCAGPPPAEVTNVLNSEIKPPSEGVLFVYDLEGGFGPKFSKAFDAKFLELARPTGRLLGTMTYIEFVRSPHNKPDVNDSSSGLLFVFLAPINVNSDGWSVYGVDYLLEVKYLNKRPLLVQKISIGTGRPYIDSKEQRGAELARTIFEELRTHKVF